MKNKILFFDFVDGCKFYSLFYGLYYFFKF